MNKPGDSPFTPPNLYGSSSPQYGDAVAVAVDVAGGDTGGDAVGDAVAVAVGDAGADSGGDAVLGPSG